MPREGAQACLNEGVLTLNAAINLCILGYILDSHHIRFWMILISYVYALFLPKIIKFFKA